MDLATGARNRVPVAQLVRRTLKEIAPHARELGSDRELEGIGEILALAATAPNRQLRVFNANRDIVEVVEEIGEGDRGRAGRARVGTGVLWHESGKAAELDELLEDGPVLLCFYLFDWSPTRTHGAAPPA